MDNMSVTNENPQRLLGLILGLIPTGPYYFLAPLMLIGLGDDAVGMPESLIMLVVFTVPYLFAWLLYKKWPTLAKWFLIGNLFVTIVIFLLAIL